MSKTSRLTLVATIAAALGAGLSSAPSVASPSAHSAPIAGTTTAIGPRDHVLVVDQTGNDDWLPLVRSTRGRGFHVDYTTVLPADLTSYGQVWWVGCYARLGAAGERQLVEFDRAGGGLLLSSEIASCGSANATTKAVADQLIATLGTRGIVYGPDGSDEGIINPKALHAAATAPQVLTSFRPSQPGSIDATAIPRRNVLVRAAGHPRYALVTVWDRSDLVGEVGGRVVIVTDINWPSSSPDNATDIFLNFATFLQGVAR